MSCKQTVIRTVFKEGFHLTQSLKHAMSKEARRRHQRSPDGLQIVWAAKWVLRIEHVFLVTANSACCYNAFYMLFINEELGVPPLPQGHLVASFVASGRAGNLL